MEPDARIIVGLVRQQGAVVIRLDDGETIEVAPDALPPDLPEVGGSLGSPLLVVLREAAARKLAARHLFSLLDRSLQTRARLRRKLLDAGHPDDAVNAVLDQAEAAGLYSDRQFAEAFCRDTLRSKPVGCVWIENKLRQKGVPRDVAADVVRGMLDKGWERELAEKAAIGRWRREAGRDRLALARVQRFLASRGFSAAVCRAAATSAYPPDDDPDTACNSGPEDPS